MKSAEQRPDSAAPWRDAPAMQGLLSDISARVTRPWRLMEVCGGQTWTLSRYRLEELLPEQIEMLHGPGCPVCVTPAQRVDEAIDLALRPNVIFCSFGDMLRVPGSEFGVSLLTAKSRGADVRLLYSPLEALEIARANPEKEVVFFAIGFETTTPIYALMVSKAARIGLKNLTLLTSLFAVPGIVRRLAADPQCRVDALLAAGHVCAVTGVEEYERLAADTGLPVVVTGFEPVDMLLGIRRAVEMLEKGEKGVVNEYARVVSAQGSPKARQAVDEVFELCDGHWRGIGYVEGSSRRLRREWMQFDARTRFGLSEGGCRGECHTRCIAGQIMKGLKRVDDCPLFGVECTPDNPVGAPMVSGEGVCAARYRYR